MSCPATSAKYHTFASIGELAYFPFPGLMGHTTLPMDTRPRSTDSFPGRLTAAGIFLK